MVYNFVYFLRYVTIFFFFFFFCALTDGKFNTHEKLSLYFPYTPFHLYSLTHSLIHSFTHSLILVLAISQHALPSYQLHYITLHYISTESKQRREEEEEEDKYERRA